MFHEGVLKEMEYVVKQFSKFLFSGDRRNTVRGKENDGSGKFKLFKFFSRSILPLPQRCCKPCLCPSCRGGQCDQWGGGGARNPCSTRLELSSTGLGGASSHCYDLVLACGFYRSRCWPCQSKQLTSQCSIKEDQGDSVCTGLGSCNSAIRFSLCDRKQTESGTIQE